MVLLRRSDDSTEETNLIPVIRAAILGSILANLLLCLGFCFFIGGARKGRDEQTFSEVVSEVGSGLLLVAGFGLMIPSAFFTSLKGTLPDQQLQDKVLHISQTTSVILFFAFLL